MSNFDYGGQGWLIRETVFDREHLAKCESIFCQGNGYLGLRAAMEEDYVGQTRGFFVTGSFDRFSENEVTELPNLPDLTNLELFIDGERFSLTSGILHSYSRSFDLRTGLLVREVDWESPRGQRLSLVFERIVSLADEHLIASRIRLLLAEGRAELLIKSGIDGRMTNSGSQHFSEGDMRVYEGRFLEMCSRTVQSCVCCALGAVHSLYEGERELALGQTAIIERRRLAAEIKTALSADRPLSIEKICTVYTSRDLIFEKDSDKEAAAKKSAREALTRAAGLGFDRIVAESAAAWDAFWQQSDIQIESKNSFDQLALRFALYHLTIMTKKNDERVGIGAKGMSGEGYKGHSFWDTEIFILPYFMLTDPQTARNLLAYRGRSLVGAYKKAKENSFEGAMFPWESAWLDDGEVTPLWGAADVVTGKPMKILTGLIEQHITADIAFAVDQYYRATGDQGFMEAWGWEIILASASFWASRGEWDADGRSCHIRDVIGPDEYKEHVDDNAYTNYLVRHNLRLALDAAELLPDELPALWQQLSEKLDLHSRLPLIKKTHDALFIPRPDGAGIIAQFAGYDRLRHIDLTKYKQSDRVGTIYNDYNIEQISSFQVLKQADVVLLMVLCGDLFSQEVKRANYDFYEARTLHDSSLSKSTHCIATADLGDLEAAYRFFRGCCETDLGPVMTSSDMGIHSACMGGIWQCVVYAFGGVRMTGEGLRIAPRLPAQWERLSFRLVWRGQPLRVCADRKGFTVRNEGDMTVSVRIGGLPRDIGAGESLTEEAGI